MLEKLRNVFIGNRLESAGETDEDHLLSKSQALAMLSSDALSSIAYGPEQVILVLTTISAAAIWWSLPIGLLVLVLLASLTISYQQVIMLTLRVAVPTWYLRKIYHQVWD